MQESNFKEDLNNEFHLGLALDKLYPKIFEKTNYTITRTKDINEQIKGIDLILKSKNRLFHVDEKAQLYYKNTSLPTFAFELSYLKNNQWHKGWLFDPSKVTDVYFLITNISFNPDTLEPKLQSVKVTSIYRGRLHQLLKDKGLSEAALFKIEKELRAKGQHGRFVIPELKARTEGALFFSRQNKNEKPINIVLKLDFLIAAGVGKTILNLK